MSDIQDYVGKIIHKAEETKDDFIFITIANFMGTDTEMSRIRMSKEILCRALVCFKQEHTEEYFRLLDESMERTKAGAKNETCN